MRVVGVDYGEARTGVAVSDLLGFMAHGVKTVSSSGAKNTANEVGKIAKHYKAGIIVVGLPKNMNNTLGERGEATLKFVRLLKEVVSCEVVTWDERLTTVSAANILNETDTKGKKRKAVIDTVAAEIILQSYLDYKKQEIAKREENHER
ncbi:MAG: Holliday junction resolvase RuvX [Firmicutes bacterium]|nr:Holliday junction resolvase RuvX [Bacillota bacterium]